MYFLIFSLFIYLINNQQIPLLKNVLFFFMPLDKIDYELITDNIKKCTLNNGLTDEENELLSKTSNILEIVSLVLKGLNNI